MNALVTVFGGGGFVGRYVVQSLLAAGARVRIVQRDPRTAWFLKPLGGLGQTQFAAADITNPAQVAGALAGSDAVINLVGILRGDLERIHVDGARNIAVAAAAAGATSLVHMSAIGAEAGAESRYAASKGAGEAAVRAAFPSATIIRPSIVFGPEDDFVNKFARLARLLPAVPVIRGAAKFQPVFAGDVGQAVAKAALDPATYGGQTYSLGGPEVITMRDLNQRIAAATGHARSFIDIPDAVAGAGARLLGWAPGAPINHDEFLMLQQDNVVPAGAAGLDTFGVRPTPLAAVIDGWLTSYRRNGRFAKTLSA